jgi:hypothetical protein
LRKPLDLRIPRSRRWPWRALGWSLVLHVVVLVLWRVEGRLPTVPHPPARTLVLIPLRPDSPRAVAAPFYLQPSNRGRGRVRGTTVPRLPEPRVVVPVPPTLPRPVEVADTHASPPRGPIERIGPELGNGRLWVRPLPLPPQDLAQKLTRTHEQLADSVVAVTIQAFLDSIGREPGADQMKLPDWTTKVGGVKFGLDSKNIYIAGLKIPAAVLALLPLPSGGNQQNALNHNGDFIYRDLRDAARRATTMEDFKEAIREIRDRKKREEEFQKAQRTEPDSVKN